MTVQGTHRVILTDAVNLLYPNSTIPVGQIAAIDYAKSFGADTVIYGMLRGYGSPNWDGSTAGKTNKDWIRDAVIYANSIGLKFIISFNIDRYGTGGRQNFYLDTAAQTEFKTHVEYCLNQYPLLGGIELDAPVIFKYTTNPDGTHTPDPTVTAFLTNFFRQLKTTIKQYKILNVFDWGFSHPATDLDTIKGIDNTDIVTICSDPTDSGKPIFNYVQAPQWYNGINSRTAWQTIVNGKLDVLGLAAFYTSVTRGTAACIATNGANNVPACWCQDVFISMRVWEALSPRPGWTIFTRGSMQNASALSSALIFPAETWNTTVGLTAFEKTKKIIAGSICPIITSCTITACPPANLIVGASTSITASWAGGTGPYSVQLIRDGTAYGSAVSVSGTSAVLNFQVIGTWVGTHTVAVKITDSCSIPKTCTTTTCTVNVCPALGVVMELA